VVDAPVVFESLAGMRAFLGSAPLNSVNTPYPVALSGVDVSGFAGGGTGLSAYDRLYRLFAAFQGRYVALDLSACTGTEITCGGGTQLNIDARPDKDKLVSLILPDSLTAIGNYAFARSSSLKSVTMNDGLEIIKADSFIECTSLSSVVLPPSVIELGLTVFNGCTALTSVTLPSSLIINMEGGSSHAFDGCTNLANFVITPVTGGQQGGKRDFREDSVWEIVNGMFSTLEDGKILMLEAAGKKEILFYPAASGHVVIPEGINKIGNSVFSGKYNPWWWEAGDIRFADNPAITGIDLPSSLEVIGWYAFRNCINLDAVTIPDGVTEIKWGAFKGCSKLTKINIPATVKNIWSDAFVGCTNLTGAVTLLEGVEEIGQSVFANTKISSLTLPSTLGKLHDPSPWGNSVTTVTFLSAVPPVITNASIEVGRLLLYDPMFFPYTNEGFQIRVPADSLELYKSTYGWNDYRWINKIVAIEQ
jgi:hypothetical protein